MFLGPDASALIPRSGSESAVRQLDDRRYVTRVPSKELLTLLRRGRPDANRLIRRSGSESAVRQLNERTT